jgi:hypothetical protein
MFEMEFHANVSKYLVLSRFLAGRSSRLDPAKRHWLRHHLFDKGRFRDDDEALRDRYHDANRWAVKFIERLLGQAARDRLRMLRRFHGATAREKLRLAELH